MPKRRIDEDVDSFSQPTLLASSSSSTLRRPVSPWSGRHGALLLFATLVLSLWADAGLALETYRISLDRRENTGKDRLIDSSDGDEMRSDVLGQRRRRILHHAPRFNEYSFAKKESDGVFYAKINIGTPPQVFSVIIDTGSSSIAVPCSECAACGAHHNRFDVSKSSTAKRTTERYHQCYQEGSCNSGDIVRDVACFGEVCDGAIPIEHHFGCCTKYAEPFQKQDADGIIGISNGPDTLIGDLRRRHNLNEDVFALCFGRHKGALTVGGVSTDPLLEPIQWVSLTPSSNSFYGVTIDSMSLNGVKLEADASSTGIVDSGSSFTYIPMNAHSALKQAFEAYCQEDPSKRCTGKRNPENTPKEDIRDAVACFSPPVDFHNQRAVDEWLRDSFPTIQISFRNAHGDPPTTICLSPTSYFWVSSVAAKAYCIGLFPDNRNRYVIGAISLIDYTVVFQHSTNRIGWAQSWCNVEETGKPSEKPKTCCGNVECPWVKEARPVAPEGNATGPPGGDLSETNKKSEKPKASSGAPLKLVNGFFFFLGMFVAAVGVGGYWLCCSGTGSIFGGSGADAAPVRPIVYRPIIPKPLNNNSNNNNNNSNHGNSRASAIVHPESPSSSRASSREEEEADEEEAPALPRKRVPEPTSSEEEELPPAPTSPSPEDEEKTKLKTSEEDERLEPEQDVEAGETTTRAAAPADDAQTSAERVP